EFKAFVELASIDQFGLKVKLPNGNVASRVLPVRIHDLDIADIKLCEYILGAVLRGIEFIYKEPGVNKPLTTNDNEKMNLNNTTYRIQINKTANGIKEIISGLTQEHTKSVSERKEALPIENKSGIQEKSIIVLPFENMSPDPDQDYFSDGLTEEIITDLSYINNLLVISRTSAMTFKGTKKKIKEIAFEVNVRYVLEGSVRKSGNNIRITAQLIDALTDTHIWAEKFNGLLDNIFDIQEKVSRSIAESLRLKLSYEEDKMISLNPISDVQAFEYYLKAKNEIYSWTDKALERALEYLQKGLEIAGDNVLIYYGIGYVHWTYINIGFKKKEECIVQAEHYANKIFKLDPDSVYMHRLLGIINLRNSKLKMGVFHLKKTLAVDPNDVDTLIWLGTTYCNVGKQYAATPLVERANKIDPLNPFSSMSSWIDILNGNFSQGLDKIKKMDKIVPNHLLIQVLHALYLAYNNRQEESYPILDKVMSEYPENLWAQMGQCLKYSLLGDREKTIKAMSGGVKEKARCDLYDALLMAECDALIGEKDEAITSLEYAVNLGAVNYPFYSEIDPFLENLRGEDRFKKLMERVKYEWENFEV
ncbi:MAG: hypothetical protein JXC36_05025, partial [Candidatus Atribacteria bacterium]|nr:hypothetical protein [Candidatus Atribacteria bacterium]